MTIEVLSPRGFCAGVTGALEKARRLAGRAGGRAVYCLHELVHNELVVNDLKSRGFVFVESVEDVPEGETVLFSAHGVAPAVRAAAAARRLEIVDATCPFVARVHREARSFAEKGLAVIVLGKADHAEVKGIVGEVESAGGTAVVLDGAAAVGRFTADGKRTAAGTAHPTFGVVSQTTMNADEVKRLVKELGARFTIETSAEVCHATKERQDAVKAFGGDALLVLGSRNSSNTLRLCEVARRRVFCAGTPEEVASLDLSGVTSLGVTAGASTPEDFISEAVNILKGKTSK